MNIKKVIFIFITILFLVPFNANAKVFTINEVATEIANTDSAKEYSALFSLSAKVDQENNKLNIYADDELALEMNYTDQYIEYINNTEITSENALATSFDAIYIYPVIEAIINLTGITTKTLKETEYNNFDQFGLIFIQGSYDFNESDENGSSSISGEYIKHLKMSLDSDKITNLINNYGEDKKEDDEAPIIDEAPVVELSNITTNSITVSAKIQSLQGVELDEDSSYPFCYFYRSTNAYEGFEQISEWAIDCVDGINIIDEELNSNTTYYYKAILDGGTKWSEVKSATTLKVDDNLNENVQQPMDENLKEEDQNNNNIDQSIKDKNGNVVENPDSGYSVPIIFLLTFLSSSLILFFKSKKRVKLSKI